MARAYATIANDGKRVDGSIMKDRPRVVQSVGFRRSGKVVENEPVAHAAALALRGGDPHRGAREGRPGGHGHARAAARP